MKEKKEEAKKNKAKKPKKERKYNLKKEIYKLILIGCIILIVSLLIYLFYFHTGKCEHEVCYLNAVLNCKRVEYINDADKATWHYTVLKKENNKCKIEVELLQTKEGETDLKNIEGKKMFCYVPLGSITEPQQNLNACTGELKEEMQNLIIKKLHSYITENIEDINEEIKNLR